MVLPSIHLAKQKSSLYLDVSPFQLQRIVSILINRYSTRGSFCNIIIPMFTLSNFAQIGILRIFLESDQPEDSDLMKKIMESSWCKLNSQFCKMEKIPVWKKALLFPSQRDIFFLTSLIFFPVELSLSSDIFRI